MQGTRFTGTDLNFNYKYYNIIIFIQNTIVHDYIVPKRVMGKFSLSEIKIENAIFLLRVQPKCFALAFWKLDIA